MKRAPVIGGYYIVSPMYRRTCKPGYPIIVYTISYHCRILLLLIAQSWKMQFAPPGFIRQKAKYIQESSRLILHKYGGEVPDEMESLLELQGVARKTANVVLGEIFGIAEGITVDTHVKRLAKRLGLTEATNPVKVERALMALIPQDSWIEISHLLIFHGRRVCFARRPNCAQCTLNDICPSADIVG